MAEENHPITCAWCHTITGYSSVRGSHGVCVGCYERLLGVPYLTPAQLDALPFGVIEIDDSGTVVSYNQAESQLSGLQPSSVVGRNFFTDIAPCTRVKAFKDRFNSVLSGNKPLEAFSFTFRFPRRTTEVEIAFVRTPSGTVFINVRQSTTEGAA
jgi:photoactive yellow protein